MADLREPRSDKKQQILDCALALLRDGGDAGLTMRKVAECAGMRLSNVQYYYKSRDDVLTAMVVHYTAECTADLKRLTNASSADTPRARARELIKAGLRHGDTLSDMCRIFRELWAISSRNAAVRAHIVEYYKNFSRLIVRFIAKDEGSPETQSRLEAILLPYIEGYSITAAAISMREDDIADLLTDIIMTAAAQGEQSTR